MNIISKILLALTLWWPIPVGILIISFIERKSGIYKLDYKTKQILISYSIIAAVVCYTVIALDGGFS